MKVLCLHGYGSSGAIFEKQLAPILAKAGGSIDFVFLDGEHPCKRAPELGAFVQGPFLCHASRFAPGDIREVHGLISAVIEEEGPFDGVIGFSQGASMALSYLLQYQIDQPEQPSPFSFAVFFSSVAALSPDPSYCMSMTEHRTAQSRLSIDLGCTERDLYHKWLACALRLAKYAGALEPDFCDDNPGNAHPDSAPRLMHPGLIKERLRIPTAHIYGTNDHVDARKMCREMSGFGHAYLTRIIQHGGRHELPRTAEEIAATWVVMEWAMLQGQQESWLTLLR